MRGQRRRQARESQAVQMNALQDDSEANLKEVRPILDEAINQLNAEDRTAILLRFFEHLDFRMIGQAIGTTDEAAKKRLSRALDKLHSLLTARGITLSVSALAAGLTTQAVKAAPAGLMARLAANALASAAMSQGANFSLLKIMTVSKISIGLASALVIVGTVLSARQHQTQIKLRDENNALRQQVGQLATEAPGTFQTTRPGTKHTN